MRPRIELPPPLQRAPFAVGQGQAIGLGQKRMRGRDLERPFRGVRVPAPSAAGVAELCAAYATIMRDDDWFSHVTAARLWGCPLPRSAETDLVHVSTPAPNRAPTGRLVVGHSVALEDGCVVERQGLRVADPASVFLQLAAVLKPNDLVAVGDHLVLTPRYPQPHERRPYVALDDLVTRVERAHGRGCRRAREAVVLVRDGAESRPETLVRLALVQGGLPEPELNPDVFFAGGAFLGRPDMLYRRQRVVVEYDGEHHRLDDHQYDRDAARLEAFQAARYDVLRARKHDLPHLGPFVNRVRAALRARS